MKSISDYRKIIPESKISEIYRKATDLSDKHIVNINATYYGGGVAEMLRSIMPLMNDAGISVGWRTVVGSPDFFQVTKKLHNAMQGADVSLSEEEKNIYERTNVEFARFTHIDHDLVLVHDPQPLPLIQFYNKRQPWIWRCHIDLSAPNQEVWDYLRSFALKYDTTVYQLKEFAADMGSNGCKMIHPALDPLTPKNKILTQDEMENKLEDIGVDTDRPFIAQVSRYDKWKDPEGVVDVYKRLRDNGFDCQLIMAGGMATDDPEGQKIFEKVKKKARDLEDAHLIVDASDLEVNAIQTGADVVLQMSKREGFGLTATEALWKGTPVVTTKVGGLQLQVDDGENGYLVEPGNYDAAADRVGELLRDETKRNRMGDKAREKVKENFLITRLVEDWIDTWRELLL